MSTHITPVARRYAAAAYQLAGQQRGAAEMLAAAEKLAVVLADAALSKRLATLPGGAMGRATFAAQLGTVLSLPDVLAKLVGLLAHNNRLAQLPGVLAALTELHHQATGTVAVQVASAVPLTAAQTEKIKALVHAQIPARNVVVHTTIQPSLLGGLKATFAGNVWDATLRHKLNRLRHTLRPAN